MNLKYSFLVWMLFLLSSGLFAHEQQKLITLSTNVHVFDGTSDELIKADVLIEGRGDL